MSIQEQAQQLAALAEEIPHGQAQGLVNTLHDLQQQTVNMLGDTGTSQELQGQFATVISEAEQAAAGLAHLKEQIATTANYHQQG